MDLSGWVGVGLGGNCDCRCGILYAAVLFFGTFCSRWGGWSASRSLLCVRVRRLGAFGFLWEREQVCEM